MVTNFKSMEEIQTLRRENLKEKGAKERQEKYEKRKITLNIYIYHYYCLSFSLKLVIMKFNFTVSSSTSCTFPSCKSMPLLHHTLIGKQFKHISLAILTILSYFARESIDGFLLQ